MEHFLLPQMDFPMPLTQFYCVYLKDGRIDVRHVLMVEFDEATGALIGVTRKIPMNRNGAIIRISKAEFKRQLAILGEMIEKHEIVVRAKRRKELATLYRENLIRNRPQRVSRAVPEDVRIEVEHRIAAGDSGVAISLSTGVSTSYISRKKKSLQGAP